MSLHTSSTIVSVVVASLAILLIDVAEAGCKTVTTFNTALTPRVNDYWNRRGIIVDPVAAESTDVLCLQELWYEDDMRNFIDNLKSIYPHHYSGLHTRINHLKSDRYRGWFSFAASACSVSEIGSLIWNVLPCAYRQGCFSTFKKSSEAGLGCLAQKCGDVLRKDNIDPDCVSCLVISSSSVNDVRSRCWRATGDDLRMNPSGLMIMSKTALPADKTYYSPYFPGQDMVLHRGYIQTEVDGVGKIVCTHLTSVFPHYWEYDLPFSSYEEQNQAEINVTYNRLQGQDYVIGGDFNTGPAVSSSDPEKNLTGEALQSYALFQHYGYDTSTYLSDDGRCTYCSDNPLVSYSNNYIDDVLVMGNAFDSVTKQRVLDQKNPPLSDHFGLRARLCKN